MVMNREILTDAIVVTPERAGEAAVVVEDGRIAEILPGRRFPEGRSLAGQLLIPGLIDTHTDYLEREARPPRNGIPRVDCMDFPLSMSFHFMDLRAVNAGITTVLGAAWITDPNQPSRWRYGDGLQLARDYQELRGRALARHLIHARWDPKFEPAEETLAQLQGIEGIGNLVYNDTTPGLRNQNIDNQIRSYVFHRKVTTEEARAHFDALIERGRALDNRGAVRAALAGRIPIGSHDDATADEVTEAHGFGATLAEMPVTLEAARRAKALGMAVSMGAPNYVWGGSHCGNLSSLNAMKEGLVDIFCSDFHFPAMLAAAVKMMENGIAPTDAFRMFTLNPARHLRLDHEIGSIAVGLKADLVAFVPRVEFGFVTHVWVDGELRCHAPYRR
ncbi:amidohydrolase family protein [Sorangium sp. So ce429]